LLDDVTASPTASTAPDRSAVPAIGSTHSPVCGQGSNAPASDRHARLALAAAVLGFFVVTLDAAW
jgi:hypothetical protein